MRKQTPTLPRSPSAPTPLTAQALSGKATQPPPLSVPEKVECPRSQPKSNPFVILNETHAGSQPIPKGIGPNGGRLQSHHALQQEWAIQNLTRYGYDPALAPTITLETGKGFPHTVLSRLQNARRDARIAAGLGKWTSTIDEELAFIVSDLREAGFNDNLIREVLEQNYRMLDKLGIKYARPSGF